MPTLATRAVVLSVCLLCAAGPARGDELPGHSHYGEAYDRGPRQSAYLMGGTGKIRFPVTSKDPLVQKFVEQGIGQLHGFWYVEAERSFREAWSRDPNCGIVYWGMSLANELNKKRAAQFAADAAKHKAGLTDREQMYIEAIQPAGTYRALIEKYPEDLEAKAFEVWRLWHKHEHFLPPNPELGTALQLAREIIKSEPMHPIHHAVIHISDLNDSEISALDSAAKCGETAPSIGHLWHMPTHIYFELDRFAEAAWQLEASIRTEHARMMHDRVLPDQVHLYAHNNEWLVRTLLYLGRVHDARRVAGHMVDLPRHPLLNLIESPEGNADEIDGGIERKREKLVEHHGSSAYYGRERVLQVLRQYENWDELIDVCESGYVEPTRIPGEQGKIPLNLGIAFYCRGKAGDVARGDEQLARLQAMLAEQTARSDQAVSEVTGDSPRELARAASAAAAPFRGAIAQLSTECRQLESYRRLAKDFFVSRRMLFVCFGLLIVGEGCVLWMLRRRRITAILTVGIAGALAAWVFQRHLDLLNLPYDSVNVDFSYMARRQLEMGDAGAAEWTAREYAANRKFQVRPQANLVEILYATGNEKEARTEFDALRELAGTADLDVPPLRRLEPIARQFGYPTDWRQPERIQKALAGRRRLETLGPLVWRPWTAPGFKLKDGQGKEHSLSDFRGKPVIVLFYLGAGCLHCKQQLEAFAKKADGFREAALDVIAVSVDDQAGVARSLKDYKPAPFPFTLLADPGLDAFRTFRVYDNFEKIALHGTFLIDGDGLVRWYDVSYEPFMDVGFVLAESKRLLSRPPAPVEPGARVIAERTAQSGGLALSSRKSDRPFPEEREPDSGRPERESMEYRLPARRLSPALSSR